MSKGFWRTEKQKGLLSNGSSITQRVSDYIKTWRERCYKEDIPDEVPAKIAASMRAPSYRAIAVAILKNDHTLSTLGFSRKETELSETLMAEKKRKENSQTDFWGMFS
jgi:predicted phosphoadenosine phosphosulfate sulfurtransferase